MLIMETSTVHSRNNKDSACIVYEEEEVAVLLDSVPELETHFSVVRKIGQGTFSSVYLGHSRKPSVEGWRKFAIKHIIPTSHPSRVLMELNCLKMFGGSDNIIGLSICLRNLNHIVLVMPYFSHDSFSDIVGRLSPEEVSDYIMNLCIALRKIHNINMVHRDIKPSNFLYSRKHRRYALIDFGLAQELGSSEGERMKTSFNTSRRSSSQGVKRTLSGESDEFSLNASPVTIPKRPCLSSQFLNLAKSSDTVSSNSPLPDLLRRSPRKLSGISSTLSKENVEKNTTRDHSVSRITEKESPIKHARLAECLKDWNPYDDIQFSSSKGSSIKENSWKPKCNPNILRRSPRKLSRTGFDISFENSSLLNPSFENSTKIHCDLSTFGASFPSHSFSGTPMSLQRNRNNSSLRQIKTRSSCYAVKASTCKCYGTAKVCQNCLGRRTEYALRAGTPGFRAPEVLLRSTNQTTAIDMWSVGVILLCLLSKRYPFFRAVDDLSSLAEITTIFGTKSIKKVAASLDKLFTSSEDIPALDLRKICEKLMERTSSKEVKINEENSSKGDLSNSCKSCRQICSDCVCLKRPSVLFPSHSLNVSKMCKNKSNVDENPNNDVKDNLLLRKDSPVFPLSAFDLLNRLLDPCPDTRITADQVLRHPFITHFH